MTRRAPRKSYVEESDSEEEDVYGTDSEEEEEEDESSEEEEEEDEEEEEVDYEEEVAKPKAKAPEKPRRGGKKQEPASRTKENEEDDDDDDFDELVPISKDDRAWKLCTDCKVLTRFDSCSHPCPPPPMSIRIIPSKIESHAKLLEAVCLRGGSAALNAEEWDEVRKETGFTGTRHRELYESMLLSVEKEQIKTLLNQILKGTSASSGGTANSKPNADDLLMPASLFSHAVIAAAAAKKKDRCGACEGCLRDDCGVCRFCKDKPKFGGKNSLKQACEKKPCSGGSSAGVHHTALEGITSPTLREPLTEWQCGLLCYALWGIQANHKPEATARCCQLCKADVRLLSAKVRCVECNQAMACASCVTSSPWYCSACVRENAPSFSTLGVCHGCGQTFTLTRVGQPCYQCSASFCSRCAPTDLKADDIAMGGGSRCFYCRTHSADRPQVGLCIEKTSTKRMKVVSLGI